MSSSEIIPPELTSSEKVAAKAALSRRKIWSRQPVVWIGFSVAVIVLLLIFKSFHSLDLKKEIPVSEKTAVLDQKSKLQTSQDLEHKKAENIENQVAVPSAETRPPASDADKSSSLMAKELPVVPPVSNETAPLPSDQIKSDEKSLDTDIETSNPQQILALENNIKALEQQLREIENQKIKKSQLWTKFQQLEIALNESKNFEAELQQFSALCSPQSKISENLQVLSPYAKKGLPSLNLLLQKFTAVKQEFMKVWEQQETGWQKLRVQLMPWIQIYNTRVTDVTSMNLWVLLRLEEATRRQDIDQIVDLVKPLSQENLPIFKSWRQEIQHYQFLIQLKKELSNQVVSEIVQ